MNTGHAAQIVVVGVEALGRLVLGALDLRLFQLRRDRANDICRHLVLQIENIFECAVETIGPQMSATGGVDELTRYANAAGCFTHTALQKIAHAQFAGDLLDVDRSAPENKAGIASD